MLTHCRVLVACGLSLTLALTGAASERTQGYLNHSDLGARLQELASQAGKHGAIEVLAKTSGGRDVWLYRLSASGPLPPEQRQGVLLIGGISAHDPTGSGVCLELAQLLTAAVQSKDDPLHKLLTERQVFIVPRLNPDGHERFFSSIWHAGGANARAVDHDRDGVVNEDGPNDLNGDGMISVMRIPDPTGPWMIDADDDRLLKLADPLEDERGTHRIEVEGVDDDGDGARNEDGPDGVELNHNFPHFFSPGNSTHGIHQLSEPEARGLAQFVVDNPQITLAIVYDMHDNLADVPKGKTRGLDGQSYRDLHPDDVETYEHISKKYKEITGLGGGPGSNPEGAVYGWLYSHQAITTFAVRPWWPIDRKLPEADEAEETEEAETATPADGAEEAKSEEKPEEKPKKKGDDKHDAKAAKQPLGSLVSGYKWLTYSDDERDGSGFLPWTRFDHPTLGAVEIGGFAPFFHSAAPASELATLGAQQAEFLAYASDLLPRYRSGELLTEDLGSGLWRVELTWTNDGYLPSHSGIARHTRQPSIVVRPDLPAERIVGGQRAQRGTLDGSGGSETARWLIRGNAGDSFKLRVYQRAIGSVEVPVTLTSKNGEG